MKKMLLISNSTMAGEPYLGWCRNHLKDFYNKHNVKKVLFIPYAGVNLSDDGLEASYNAYESRVAGVFAELGLEQACQKSPLIRSGVNLYRGRCVYKHVANDLEIEYTPLESLIEN